MLCECSTSGIPKPEALFCSEEVIQNGVPLKSHLYSRDSRDLTVCACSALLGWRVKFILK